MSNASARWPIGVGWGVGCALLGLAACRTGPGTEGLPSIVSSTSVSVGGEVTLAPDGAYPVLTPEESRRADLAPGTYRLRLDHQADWPEQCLDEMVVFPHGQPTPDAPTSTTGFKLPVDWEQQAIDRQNRIRELREPICRPFR